MIQLCAAINGQIVHLKGYIFFTHHSVDRGSL